MKLHLKNGFLSFFLYSPVWVVYSFSKISETLLLGWISGAEAKYMESLTMDTVADVCTDMLRKFLRDPLVPKPKRCIW